MKKIEQCDCDVIHQESVDKVNGNMPDQAVLDQMATLFKAFSDKTRMGILSALAINELCVCDIASVMNMSKSSISHQLKFLRLAGLIDFTKIGKVVYYRLKDEHVEVILTMGHDHVGEHDAS